MRVTTRAIGQISPEWLPVWLSESEVSGTAVCQAQHASDLYRFDPDKELQLLQLAGLQALRSDFQDRNMPLNCGNVELRGLEPLASCMPYKSGDPPPRALA